MDPAEELRHFDVLLLRYLRRVNSELREQAVNVRLHQICEGADSGAPSLDNIFPAGTLVFGNFPSLFGFNLSFFSRGIGFLRGASVLIFTSERAAMRASSRAAFSFSKEATRSSIPASREARSLSIPNWREAQREATKAFRERSSTSRKIWLAPVAIKRFSMRGKSKEEPASVRNLLSRSLLENRRVPTILPPDQLCLRHPENSSHLNRVGGAHVIAAALRRSGHRGPSDEGPDGWKLTIFADSGSGACIRGNSLLLETQTVPLGVFTA